MQKKFDKLVEEYDLFIIKEDRYKTKQTKTKPNYKRMREVYGEIYEMRKKYPNLKIK